jgi:hypothetical protein
MYSRIAFRKRELLPEASINNLICGPDPRHHSAVFDPLSRVTEGLLPMGAAKCQASRSSQLISSGCARVSLPYI